MTILIFSIISIRDESSWSGPKSFDVKYKRGVQYHNVLIKSNEQLFESDQKQVQWFGTF